jgi:predicted nucleic acid-binding protein
MLTILDTDVLSELRLPSPTPSVAAWFAELPADDIALAAFTITEIEYGIAVLPAREAEFAARLKTWLEMILATHRVLPLDAGAASLLGRMYALPALRNLAVTHPRAGRPRFGGDLVIAATAISHSAAVATRNHRDFALIAQHFPKLRGIDPFGGRSF